MDNKIEQQQSKRDEVQMIETNNKEKSNKCNQCGYVPSQVSNLRKHLRIHSGEKLYKCNQCEYASTQTGHLRTHLKTHSGEKSNM